MGRRSDKFVGKAEAGEGWRVWDRKMKKWWGERYRHYPEILLSELNGAKRPERLTELVKQLAGDRTRTS